DNFVVAGGDNISIVGGTVAQSGGSMTCDFGDLRVGEGAGTSGIYTLNANLTSVIDRIGDGGTGTFTQSGGTHTATFVTVATASGATGTVNENGGSVTAAGIYVGGVWDHSGGTGVLNIAGANVTSTGETKVWNTSGSAINLSAG